MDFKAHARYSLEFARRLTEGVIASFQSEKDWLYQVHPQANHPLWIVGHLPLADNMIASKFRPELDDKPEGWDQMFGTGSQPQGDAGAYPPVDKVLAYFRERRETLLKVLDDLSDEELAAPAPAAGEMSPIAGAPCLGHAFLFLAYHEGVHAGQITIAHRGLGYSPLFGPRTEAEEKVRV